MELLSKKLASDDWGTVEFTLSFLVKIFGDQINHKILFNLLIKKEFPSKIFNLLHHCNVYVRKTCFELLLVIKH